jgi:hypothetical protein
MAVTNALHNSTAVLIITVKSFIKFNKFFPGMYSMQKQWPLNNIDIYQTLSNTETRGQCYKTLYKRNLQIFEISLSVCRLSGAPLYGRLLALPPNIRLGWQRLKNTILLQKFQITAVKGFITFAPENMISQISRK